jgi:NAD(P)-dependent dehydrogenase (short-subunit alcohol dehydrogenase family)
MLLENKVAVIYGAGGPIGGAIARAFAREGASVFLTGRTEEKLNPVADDIRSKGGSVETSIVDALDEDAVDQFVDRVINQARYIDISFNVISYGDIQKPLIELSVDEFLQPIATALRTQFLTTKAVIPHMTNRGSGVIMHFGGNGPQTLAGLGGFKVALDAIEGLRRQWAIEFGKQGIRVVTLKTGGIVDSMPESMPGRDQIAASILESAMLNRTATLEDVGNVAAFVASDQARTMTSTEINISCGAIVD